MSQEKDVYISYELLKSFIKEVFIKCNVPPDDAEICSDLVIQADLRGISSHGVNRLKMYVERIKDKIQLPITNWKIVKDNHATALIDGGNGMGQVVSYHSMKLAIEKAKKYGCGVVSVRNSNHFGIAGYYPLMAVKENMIGIAFTNARPSVSPTFGVEPLLGTNPISIGFPTNLPYPFLLDIATSISQRGKIEYLAKKGEKTPEGWVIDREGNYLTDSEYILKALIEKKASFLPLGGLGETLGGHKGYGLAVMIEILSAALGDSNYLQATSGRKNGKKVPYRLGHLFIAINIENFISLDRFKEIVTDIIQTLQNSQKLPNQEKIYIAGEKEYLNEQQRRKEGIPIEPGLQKVLLELKEELKIDNIKLPF